MPALVDSSPEEAASTTWHVGGLRVAISANSYVLAVYASIAGLNCPPHQALCKLRWHSSTSRRALAPLGWPCSGQGNALSCGIFIKWRFKWACHRIHTLPSALPETKIHWHQKDIPKYPGTALGAPSSHCRHRRSRSRGEQRASQAKPAPPEASKPQNFKKCRCT